MTRTFVLTLIAVFVGIAIWSRMTKTTAIAPGSQYKDVTGNTVFAGPDVDPQTGAYTGPGARPGTVQFSSQGL